jgi:hypothetical protein
MPSTAAISEAGKQAVGHWLGVAPGQGEKQRHFEKFVVRQGVRPGAQKLSAHTGAVKLHAGGGQRCRRVACGLGRTMLLFRQQAPVGWGRAQQHLFVRFCQ